MKSEFLHRQWEKLVGHYQRKTGILDRAREAQANGEPEWVVWAERAAGVLFWVGWMTMLIREVPPGQRKKRRSLKARARLARNKVGRRL